MTVDVRNEGDIEKEDLEIKSTNFQLNNDQENNDVTRDYIVINGFVQNMHCDFIKSKRQYDLKHVIYQNLYLKKFYITVRKAHESG